MPNRIRILMVAAMNLTAMAHAQANDQPTSNHTAQRPPTEAQVGESWRYPGNVRARSAEPSGRPGWLVAGLGVLVAALVLAGGLAVTTTRRARRGVRVGQAA